MGFDQYYFYYYYYECDYDLSYYLSFGSPRRNFISPTKSPCATVPTWLGLGVGLGVGIGVGLGLGVGVGAGLGVGFGLGVGVGGGVGGWVRGRGRVPTVRPPSTTTSARPG
jgi:hypothetical protein